MLAFFKVPSFPKHPTKGISLLATLLAMVRPVYMVLLVFFILPLPSVNNSGHVGMVSSPGPVAPKIGYASPRAKIAVP